MEAKEIIRKMREDDRLLKESKVMKSVQKAIIELGYEPFGEKQEKIYEAIEKTPTASAWIPCSERLPEEYGEYLCVNKYGKYILGYPRRNKADEDLVMVETESEILLEVLAWQPLPQPYVKGE